MVTQNLELYNFGANLKSGLQRLLKYIHISNNLIGGYIEAEEKEAGKSTSEFYKEYGEISEFEIGDLCKEYFDVASFPEILYRSIFYETISFFETNLCKLNRMINKLEAESDEIEKIKRKIYKHEIDNNLQKSKNGKYKLYNGDMYGDVKNGIKQFMSPDCLDELWDKFEIFRDIRNHLYHDGSMEINDSLKENNKARYKKIIKASEDDNRKLDVQYLEKIEHGYKLKITKEFCLELLITEKNLFENILRNLGKNYAPETPLGNEFLQEAFYIKLLDEDFKMYK